MRSTRRGEAAPGGQRGAEVPGPAGLRGLRTATGPRPQAPGREPRRFLCCCRLGRDSVFCSLLHPWCQLRVKLCLCPPHGVRQCQGFGSGAMAWPWAESKAKPSPSEQLLQSSCCPSPMTGVLKVQYLGSEITNTPPVLWPIPTVVLRFVPLEPKYQDLPRTANRRPGESLLYVLRLNAACYSIRSVAQDEEHG